MSVRGCLLVAIMILDYVFRMHTYLTICKTPMHESFKWSVICTLAGVHISRAKCAYYVHAQILSRACVLQPMAVDSQYAIARTLPSYP